MNRMSLLILILGTLSASAWAQQAITPADLSGAVMKVFGHGRPGDAAERSGI
jgi:hypothetical protein